MNCNILYGHVTKILADDLEVCNNQILTIKTFILNEFPPPKLPLFLFAVFMVVSIAKNLNSCILGLSVTKLFSFSNCKLGHFVNIALGHQFFSHAFP